MKVLVAGGTGFTGSYVVRALLQEGLKVRCYVRPSADTGKLPLDRLEIAVGDLAQPDSLRGALEGCDALVNVASLGFGHAPEVVRAATSSGVRRAVFFSSTSIFTSLNAPSKRIRLEAEEAVRTSGLEFTLVRPTMIYGSSGDRNIARLVRYLSRWPVITIPGNGRSTLQPVYVADLAEATVRCLKNPLTIGKAYNLSGADSLTFNQLVSTICAMLNRKVLRLHLPLRPIGTVVGALERLPIRFPIRAEQVLRLAEDKSFSHRAAREDFGYNPLTFEQGLRRQLRQMGLLANR